MKLLLHLSIFFIILFISLPSSYSCTPNEKNALLEIMKSLNTRNAPSDWNPKTDCCSGWTGVECTNRRVTTLYMTFEEFHGQISTRIGDLGDLKFIYFGYMPHLTGTIPRTITKLKNLDFLRIFNTNISGPIPDYISELKNVKTLDLSFSQFTGPIPGSLSQMPKLENLNLMSNKLTGSIPNSFGSFVGKLSYLYLFNNKLSGRIPKSFSKYDFNEVDVSRNRFIGDGSMFFGQNKTTIKVDLSNNMFQFDLSKVRFAKTITVLDLSRNRIFGNLPRQLGEVGIHEFNVSYNRLCGEIPRDGYDLLQTYGPTAFSHNLCLCGPPLKPC